MDNDNLSLEQNIIDKSVFLSGGKFTFSSKELRGGSLSAVLGSNKIILNNADMAGSTLTLDVFAFWGSIELYIPKNWNINVKCVPVMGAIQHKVLSEENIVEKNKTLTINGTIIMSNVEINS